jgi:hypothetical protein
MRWRQAEGGTAAHGEEEQVVGPVMDERTCYERSLIRLLWDDGKRRNGLGR